MKYIIVTGISGAGKSTVLTTLEDLGYHCVDNMPTSLIPEFVKMSKGNIQKVAIGLDSRSAFDFGNFESAINTVRKNCDEMNIVFVDCADSTVVTRYKETRRRHPLMTDENLSLVDAIAKDRELLKDIKNSADTVIDTTKITSAMLRERVRLIAKEKTGLSVVVMSFGFKYGIPTDADLVFDVRCFPNPFYVPELREKTGLDDEVYDYVFSSDEVKQFMDRISELERLLMPLYEKEGKSQITVAIGCTGGKHRSVSIARALGEKFSKNWESCIIIHRDIKR